MNAQKPTPPYDEAGYMLSVDTSTAAMTASLSQGDRLIGEITSQVERNHSLYLVPALQRLMADAGIRPAQLSAFAAGIGPGSYTGTRIGVTVAKTFAWTHGLALLSVSTLEAMALGGLESLYDPEMLGTLPVDPGAFVVRQGQLSSMEQVLSPAAARAERSWVVPLIDARRGQVFTGLYEASPEGWQCLIPDGIRLMEGWLEELLAQAGTAEPHRFIFTGDAHLHQEGLHSFSSRFKGTVTENSLSLRARHVAELGRICWKQGDTADVHGLVPNYTQLAEAEANLLAAKRS